MDCPDEDDLYSDLPNFKYNESIDKLQSANMSLLAQVAQLEVQIENLARENSEYREKCNTLKTNISSIYKTAQNEIKRKDKRINELNREIITLKTRSFKLRRKRSRADLNEDSREEYKKVKLENENKLDKNTSEIEPVTSKSDGCNSSYSSSIASKDSFGASEKPPKVLHVPNINCPTLYSQRMFKKIYNADPINQVANDFEAVKASGDSSPNTSKNLHNKLNSDDQSSTLNDGNLFLNSKKSCSESSPCVDKSNLTNVRNTNNLQNSEQNNNTKALTDLNSENQIYPDSIILDNETKKDDLVNEVHSGNLPNNLHEISKNIPVKDLRNIISNVMNCNNEKESQHPQNTDSLILKDKTPVISNKISSDTNKSLEIQKVDKDSGNKVSDAFGLKLLSRPNKTTFCPISGQWSSKVQKKEIIKELKLMQQPGNPPRNEKDHGEKIDIMEALFGSPLKWAENSVDDIKPTPKLNPPITAYEDSCSAQIENSKFQKTIKETTLQKPQCPNKVTDCTNPSAKTGKGFQTSELMKKSLVYSGIQRLEEAPTWPFQQVKETNNQITNFSTFANCTREAEDCKLPSLSLSVDQTSSQPSQLDRISLTSPKYNDSILGQFDDTTQLISALARDHSKISPIHTPIKENKSEAVSSPDNKSEVKDDLSINKVAVKINQPPRKSKRISPLVTQTTVRRKSEKKAILLDAPINILHPRKTPRNIQDKKTNSPKKDKNVSVALSVKEDAVTKNYPNHEVPSSSASGVKKSTLLTVQNFKVSSISEEVIERVQAIKHCESYRKYKYEAPKIKFKANIKNEAPAAPIDKSAFLSNTHSVDKDSCRSRSSSPKMENSPGNSSLPTRKENLPRSSTSEKKENSPKSCCSSTRKENSPGSCSLATRENSPRNYSSSTKKENSLSSSSNKNDTSRCSSSSVKLENSPRSCSSSSVKTENSPSCSSSAKKENSPRNYPSSAIKENYSYQFKREDRNFKKSSYHFKKPSSYYSRYRQNCRFRHSSVERKLIKDHRHANRVRNTPVREVKREDGVYPCLMKSHEVLNCWERSTKQSSMQTIISSPDAGLSKSTKCTGNADSPRLKNIDALKFDYPQTKNNHISINPDISHQKTTHIRRMSKKIDWSSITSVVSTNSAEHTPEKPKSESIMKWFLQPIDFNVTSPVVGMKTTIKTSTGGDTEKPLKQDPSITSSSVISSPNKSIKSPGIVIVPRKRPAKFGVSEC